MKPLVKHSFLFLKLYFSRSTSFDPTILPASLGHSESSSREYAAFMASVQPMFRNFTVNVVEDETPIIDEVAHKIVLHLKRPAETDLRLYRNEYVSLSSALILEEHCKNMLLSLSILGISETSLERSPPKHYDRRAKIQGGSIKKQRNDFTQGAHCRV